MSDIRYINNLKVGEKISENTELALFEGIATTDSLNSYFYRMADDSLSNMAQDAKDGDGKPVYANHLKDDRLNMGRTVDASLYKKQVKMLFSILRGLNDVGSDDVIRRLENRITTELSVGHEHAVYKCNLDNTKMKMRGRMEYMPRCEQGHHPGQEMREKGKNITVTATAHGVRLVELSIVGTGADPNTNLIGKLKQDLADDNINGKGLAFLSEFYNLNYNHFFNQLGYNGYTPKQYSIPTPPTPQPKQSPSDALYNSVARRRKEGRLFER